MEENGFRNEKVREDCQAFKNREIKNGGKNRRKQRRVEVHFKL